MKFGVKTDFLKKNDISFGGLKKVSTFVAENRMIR